MSAAPTSSSRLAVCLFTDLVDSAGWKRTLLDQAYADELLRVHNRLFRDLLARYPPDRTGGAAGGRG
jgi:hypothetical protein